MKPGGCFQLVVFGPSRSVLAPCGLPHSREFPLFFRKRPFFLLTINRSNIMKTFSAPNRALNLQKNHRPCARPVARRTTFVRAEGTPAGGSGASPMGLSAPVKLTSSVGQFLSFYLKDQPHLFRDAMNEQLNRIKEEKEAREAEQQKSGEKKDAFSLQLSKRVEEVRMRETRLSVEDILYVSLVERFVKIGVDLLPPLDGFVDVPPCDLTLLTNNVHSKEAIEVVKEHLMSIMGPAASAYSTSLVKMSKLQGAQVYAASVMFGYFLRRVDKRFQLDQFMGTLPSKSEDSVARLEKLFREAPSADQPTPSTSSTSSSSAPKKPALRAYIESFDQKTLADTARVVSVEAAALVERQTAGVFGDIAKLQAQMKEVVGEDARTLEELMQRVQGAVAENKVEALTMTVQTQRRMVLEAVAYGAFLRDVEQQVDTEHSGVLTYTNPAAGPNMLPPNDV